MPILPLPQFEADLAEQDREIYERLKPPSSVVVRFGHMKMVGEFPYSGEAKPGCGSKMVVKTHRGTELGEMLTSTCPNSGCSKSVSRQEMLAYIDNSGGRDYPFFSMQGKVLRIATAEDLNEQARIDSGRVQMAKQADAISRRMNLNMRIVDAEPILGGEKLTFHFTSEDRIDFRELVNELAALHHTRIEMRQVGARDEARLTADYERCGQHCCCKQFLKVLKPISMKSAKIQKATLDPLKISGRCGRLMCCLRYEDQTYDELRARLPRKKSRVKTPEGWGTVLDGQILTQLVLVQLDSNGEQVAVPVENLEDAATAGAPPPPPPPPSQGSYGPPPRAAGGPSARSAPSRRPNPHCRRISKPTSLLPKSMPQPPTHPRASSRSNEVRIDRASNGSAAAVGIKARTGAATGATDGAAPASNRTAARGAGRRGREARRINRRAAGPRRTNHPRVRAMRWTSCSRRWRRIWATAAGHHEGVAGGAGVEAGAGHGMTAAGAGEAGRRVAVHPRRGAATALAPMKAMIWRTMTFPSTVRKDPMAASNRETLSRRAGRARVVVVDVGVAGAGGGAGVGAAVGLPEARTAVADNRRPERGRGLKYEFHGRTRINNGDLC